MKKSKHFTYFLDEYVGITSLDEKDITPIIILVLTMGRHTVIYDVYSICYSLHYE